MCCAVCDFIRPNKFLLNSNFENVIKYELCMSLHNLRAHIDNARKIFGMFHSITVRITLSMKKNLFMNIFSCLFILPRISVGVVVIAVVRETECMLISFNTVTLKKNRWTNRENRKNGHTTNIWLLFNLKRARDPSHSVTRFKITHQLTKTTTKMIRQSNVMYFIILIFTTNDNIWEISTEETTKKKARLRHSFNKKKWIAVINNNRVSERRGKSLNRH